MSRWNPGYLHRRRRKRKSGPKIAARMGSSRTRRKKRLLIERDGGHCKFCNVQLTLDINAPNQMSLDHVVPRSKGGSNDITNLQLLCRICNTAKADKIL